MDKEFPYRFEELSYEENELVKQHFLTNSACNDLIRVVDKESDQIITTLNRSFITHHHLVHKMQIRADDVWIVTYPKCGTTWTQEITWNVMHDLKLDRTSQHLFERSPFIDIPMIDNSSLEDAESFFNKIESMPSPRTIKTHYPFELLPPNLLESCKVIFVCRNIKDACVSYYHHNKLFKSFDFHSQFMDFAPLYQKGLVLQGGYFEMLRSGWSRRSHPNLLFFWYEEMKQDQKTWIMKIMKHIGYELSDNKIEELCEAMQFENYKKTSSMNQMTDRFNEDRGEFTRKGIVGDWINHFTDEMSKDWNNFITENLNDIGVRDQRICQYFITE